MKHIAPFLGLDLGEKTLGIAFSETGIISFNLTTFNFPNHQYHYLLKPLKELVLQKQVQTIILGYPKHMNNDLGVKGLISIDFKKQLEKYLSRAVVVLWDERLSTKQALQCLKNNTKKNKKKLKDEIAAMLILQNFLDYQNNIMK